MSRTIFTGCETTPRTFCHSERSEESLLLFTRVRSGEIPRSARNDKIDYFFRILFRLSAFLMRREKIKLMRRKPREFGLAATLLLSICVPGIRAQQQIAMPPETALSDALSAACRQDSSTFGNSLTTENAAAFRTLPSPQRTAMMKRFVLLEEPGRPLLATSNSGQKIVRCESPSFTTEMRLGEAKVRENLTFIPMEIPITGEEPRTVTIGLVREGGNWKLLSVGLILLDVPAMAKQWAQADLEANEDAAIADMRSVAAAAVTYRNAYGVLPETLAALGPAPAGGVSPDAAGLLDAGLAAGEKDGYTFRYVIVPATDFAPGEDSGKAVNFSIASSPKEYGKMGRRSFFLDSSGILRGADKKGGNADHTDPRIGPS